MNMKHPRRSRVWVMLGDALLLASFIAPWVTVYSHWAQPPEQWVSPASTIWYTLTATPYSVSGPQAVMYSLIYICATLVAIGMTVPLVRGVLHGERFSNVALVTIGAMLPSFLSGLLALPFLPMGLEFGVWFSDVTLSLGIPCVILGGLLAIVGLTDMAR